MEQEMMMALAKVGGYAAVGLAAMGSSMGTGIAGAAAKTPGMWPLYLAVGVFGGLAQMFSALFQGRAAAGGCNSFAETNQGFANDLMILGVVETCAIFALVFSIMVMA